MSYVPINVYSVNDISCKIYTYMCFLFHFIISFSGVMWSTLLYSLGLPHCRLGHRTSITVWVKQSPIYPWLSGEICHYVSADRPTLLTSGNLRNVEYSPLKITFDNLRYPAHANVFLTSRLLQAHYNDVITCAMASQITGVSIVYSIVCSGADQRKHQSSASLAFVRGIYRDRWIPFTRASNAEMFPFDGVIMNIILGRECEWLLLGQL